MENKLAELKKEIETIDEEVLVLLEERIKLGTKFEAMRRSVLSVNVRESENQKRLDRICVIGRMHGLDYYFVLAVFYTIFQCCRQRSMYYDIEDD